MRRRFAALGSLAFALALIASAPSCGSGFLDGLSGGAREAGAEGAAPVDAEVDARTCSLRHPPAKPEIADNEVPGALQFAIDALRIDDSETADASIPPGVGFDLDQACTCPEPETCVVPLGAKRCDKDGGIDNALGRLFGFLGSVFPKDFGPDFATDKIRKGAYTVILTLAGWNREPNDPKVVLAVYSSPGLVGTEDGGTAVPKRDGTDVWTVDPASVENGDAKIGTDCTKRPNDCFPAHYSTDAWVADGVLYARIDAKFSLSATGGRISLDFDDVQFVGRLLPFGGDRYRLDGEFVGRWRVGRVLSALGNVKVGSTPLCEQAAFYNAAKEEVCGAVDLPAAPGDEGRGKPCEALSAVFRVSAIPAFGGPITPSEISPPSCPPKEDDCSGLDAGAN